MLDIQALRSQFPALRRGAAFFDGPGGTQVPQVVADRLTDYLLHHNANTHWAYPTSQETDRLLGEARGALSTFLNCAPDEVVLGNNMTTLTFHLSRTLARSWQPGDEVVVTELDHHANQDPWRQAARDRGLTVRTVAMDPATGQLDYGDLERQVGPRTRLVAVGAASNALGTINDLARVRELAGPALLFVDAVHYAPHALVDVQRLGCDFLACSAYKFYGPHVGVLFVRKQHFAGLDAPKLEPAPGEAPEKLETGTLNHEGIVGAGEAVRFLSSLGEGEGREALRSAYATLHHRGERLLARLWEGLSALPGVKLYGPPPDRARTPTVAFTVGEQPSQEVARRLGERGVYVSHGDFYATTVVRRLGLQEQSLLRAGCACYTDDQDVERLLQGLKVMI